MTTSGQTFFVEMLQTPTGAIQVVTDAADRLRAVDWDDHAHRLHRLMTRYYGAQAITVQPAPHPSAAGRALQAYFDGDLAAINALPTETNGTAFQRLVWDALRTIPAGRDAQLQRLGGADRPAVGGAGGGPGQRGQPDLHRRAMPPGDRREWVADRLRRRRGAQALAART